MHLRTLLVYTFLCIHGHMIYVYTNSSTSTEPRSIPIESIEKRNVRALRLPGFGIDFPFHLNPRSTPTSPLPLQHLHVSNDPVVEFRGCSTILLRCTPLIVHRQILPYVIFHLFLKVYGWNTTNWNFKLTSLIEQLPYRRNDHYTKDITIWSKKMNSLQLVFRHLGFVVITIWVWTKCWQEY